MADSQHHPRHEASGEFLAAIQMASRMLSSCSEQPRHTIMDQAGRLRIDSRYTGQRPHSRRWRAFLGPLHEARRTLVT